MQEIVINEYSDVSGTTIEVFPLLIAYKKNKPPAAHAIPAKNAYTIPTVFISSLKSKEKSIKIENRKLPRV